MQKKSKTKAALAVYLREQWPRLLQTADDSEKLEATWEEWREGFEKAKTQFLKRKIDVTEIIIDLDQLEKYCEANGLKNTASTRSKYAVHVLLTTDRKN